MYWHPRLRFTRRIHEKSYDCARTEHLSAWARRLSIQPKGRYKAINCSFFIRSSRVGRHKCWETRWWCAVTVYHCSSLWIAGPESGENLNKYVIYSEHKTFKAFINGSFLQKCTKEREEISNRTVCSIWYPRHSESHSQDERWHEQRGTNQRESRRQTGRRGNENDINRLLPLLLQ